MTVKTQLFWIFYLFEPCKVKYIIIYLPIDLIRCPIYDSLECSTINTSSLCLVEYLSGHQLKRKYILYFKNLNEFYNREINK